jgi:DNA-binding transcriptional MerR regulator
MTTYDGSNVDIGGWPEGNEKTAMACESDTVSIGELAREYGVSQRALRFYQAKGLLTPMRSGKARRFSAEDRERLTLILQAKRLRFTLTEARAMLKARRPGSRKLPISRRQCVEQIRLLEGQHRDLEGALHELRQIYTDMSNFGGRSEEIPAKRF